MLHCDGGWTNAEIREALDVSEQTIGNIRQPYRVGGDSTDQD
jgi:hypothetical protein